MFTTLKKYGFKNITIVIKWCALVLGLVYAASTAVLAQSELDSSHLEQSAIVETQRYAYRDSRTFRMHVPVRWVAEDLDFYGKLARYTSSEGGEHYVDVARHLSPNESTVDMVIEHYKQYLQEEEGQSNFVLVDGTLSSGDKFVLLKSNGPDQEDEGIMRYKYTYVIKKGPTNYVVACMTTDENMHDTFAQMVNSISVSRR